MAQNRYKKLLSNTLVFAIGTFSSKVLVFLMLPYYTNILSTGEYGTVDALINVGQLMIPIASVGINNAVIRFGLENESDKKTVFSNGLYTILAGFAVLAVISPILPHLMDFMSGYTIAVLAFVLASSLRTLCIQFALSLGFCCCRACASWAMSWRILSLIWLWVCCASLWQRSTAICVRR